MMGRPNVNVIISGPSNEATSQYKTKILRANIPFDSQVVSPDTKYVIKYDFDLNGLTVYIPENCIIEVDGGQISNGTLVGKDTILINTNQVDDILKNVTKEGTWKELTEEDLINRVSVIEETLENVAYIGEDDGEAIIADFDPQSDSLWKAELILTDDEKDLIRENINSKDASNGMGRIILKKNKTFAEQVTQKNTIYVILYDYDLNEETVTIPEGCILDFQGGSLKNGTVIGLNTQIRADLKTIFETSINIDGTWDIPSIYPRWFGAIGDGLTNNNKAFANIVTLINNSSTLTSINFTDKHYVMTEGWHFKKNITINGNSALLDFQNAGKTYTSIEVHDDIPYYELDAGTVTMSKGTNVINITKDLDLQVGDYIKIYNTDDFSWSPNRYYYRAGDLFKVSEVNGLTITVTDYATQDYEGNIVLYKFNPVSCTIKDIDLKLYSDDTIHTDGIYVKGGLDIFIDNIRANGSYYAHVVVDHCYSAMISKVSVDCETIFKSLNYGIVVASSKNVVVNQCYCKTTRHGLSTGGGSDCTPCRNIIVSNCIFDTYQNVAALDTHENIENVKFDNNIIYGGLSHCGGDCEITNNTIHAGLSGYGLYIVHNSLGTVKVFNNKFIYDNAKKTKVSYKSNIMLSAPSKIVTDEPTIIIENNEFTSNLRMMTAHIYAGNFGVDSATVVIKNNIFNEIYNVNNVLVTFLYTGSNFRAKNLYVIGNTIKSTLNLVSRTQQQLEMLVVKDNIIHSKVSLSQYSLNNYIINNKLINTTTGITVNTGVDEANYYVSGNNITLNMPISTSTNSASPFIFLRCKNVFVTNNTVRLTYNEGTVSDVIDVVAINVSRLVFKGNKFEKKPLDVVATRPARFANIGEYEVEALQTSGTTRPKKALIGQMFFDTTLNKPIYCKTCGFVNNVSTTTWVDATGEEV